MSLDPNDDELNAMSDVNAAASWADLTGTDTASPRASFFTLMGLEGDEPPRVVAAISDDDFATVVSKWMVGSDAPTPTQLGQVGLFRRACQLMSGTILSIKEQLAADQRTAEAKVAAAAAAKAQATTTPATEAPSASTSSSSPKIKLSLINNQMLDNEFSIVEPEKLTFGYANFKNRLGANPASDQECTAEPLSAFQAIIQSGAPPRADMSVWGP